MSPPSTLKVNFMMAGVFIVFLTVYCFVYFLFSAWHITST